MFVLMLGFSIDISRNILGATAQSASVSEATLSLANVVNGPQKRPEAATLDLQATAAIMLQSDLIDPDRILFSKEAQTPLPSASLTKLMTAVIVLDTYERQDPVIISAEAMAQDPLVTDVQEGQIYTVDELLHIMLIESSNRAAYALAEHMGVDQFVSLMNVRAAQFGLTHTSYAEPTGISPNNMASAADLAHLALVIMRQYPDIVSISEMPEITLPSLGRVFNTNKLLGQMSGIVLGKTGFTLDAKGCLLLVVYHAPSKQYLVNVVLGADERFSEMQKMVDWVNTAYIW